MSPLLPPGNPSPLKTGFLIKEGVESLKAGRPERAIESFDAACAQLDQPHDPLLLDTLLQKGKALYKLGRDQEAAGCFGTVATTLPAFGHQAWGQTLVELGRPLEALGHIQIACLVQPGNPNLIAQLASIQCNLDLLNDAKATIAKAVDLAPRNPFVRLEQGNIFWKAGQLDDAVDSYRRSLDEAPNDTQAMGKLGVLLLARGEFTEADALLSKALASMPDEPGLLLHHAHTLAHLKQPQAALENLSRTQGLELPPRLLLQKAQVNNLLGRHKECLEECDRIISLLPDNLPALILRSIALFDLGRRHESKIPLEQACALHPTVVICHTNLGKHCVRMGDSAGARAMLDKARALDPTHTSVVELGELIKRMQADPAENKKKRSHKRRKIADSGKDPNARV